MPASTSDTFLQKGLLVAFCCVACWRGHVVHWCVDLAFIDSGEL